jgi:hypothetical protein
LLTSYTATYEDGVQLPKPGGGRANVQFLAVDPALYPYAGEPALTSSAGGGFQAVLRTPGNAVVSTDLLASLGGTLGQTLRITAGLDSRQFEIKIAGVIEPQATLGQGESLYVSLDTFRGAARPRSRTRPFTPPRRMPRGPMRRKIRRRRASPARRSRRRTVC